MEIQQASTLLCNKSGKDQSGLYYFISCDLPFSCSLLTLDLTLESREPAQIPVAVFSPGGEVRLFKAPEGGVGKQVLNYHIGTESASSGGIKGVLEKGTWRIILYKRRMKEDIPFSARISYEKCDDEEGKKDSAFTFAQKVLSRKAGWYSGELHVHSSHSTGRDTISTIIAKAKKEKLDFLAITDHFTTGHWCELEEHETDGLVLFQSEEISGARGHANLHGLKRWGNPFIDENEELAAFLGFKERPSMESLADMVHAGGGLFSINHAESGIVGWRYHEFPIEKADVMEVLCTADKALSILYTTLWDSYLVRGFRLIGVGSSDSHKAEGVPYWEIGRVRTFVKASTLSQKGIIEGIKSGNCFVSYGECRMEFDARDNGGTVAEMGGTATSSDTLEFHVTLMDIPDGNLFIFLNGQIHDVVYFGKSEKKEYTFSLNNDVIHLNRVERSYIRLEYHEEKIKELYWGMASRTAESVRLISNPIWLKDEK